MQTTKIIVDLVMDINFSLKRKIGKTQFFA